MKLGRNDICWCGSNKKYKSCHLTFDEKIADFEEQGAMVPSRDMITLRKRRGNNRRVGSTS